MFEKQNQTNKNTKSNSGVFNHHKNNQEKQSINNQTSMVEISKNENVDQLLESAEKSVVAENSTKAKSKIKNQCQ